MSNYEQKLEDLIRQTADKLSAWNTAPLVVTVPTDTKLAKQLKITTKPRGQNAPQNNVQKIEP